MGGSRRGGDDVPEGVRPVEPEEARERGDDPGAVTIHRRGGTGGERSEGRTAAGRRDEDEREETGARQGDRGNGSGAVEGMGRGEKTLISTLAVLGVVLLAAILVLSLLQTPEWMQFVLALVLFAALGLGAYLYVITPSGRGQETDGN